MQDPPYRNLTTIGLASDLLSRPSSFPFFLDDNIAMIMMMRILGRAKHAAMIKHGKDIVLRDVRVAKRIFN